MSTRIVVMTESEKSTAGSNWLGYFNRALPWLVAVMCASTIFSIALANMLLALLVVLWSFACIAGGGSKIIKDPLLLPALFVLVVRLLSLILSPVAPTIEDSAHKIIFILPFFIISQMAFSERQISWLIWILLGIGMLLTIYSAVPGIAAVLEGKQVRIRSTSGGYYTLAMLETLLISMGLAAAFYTKATRWRIILFICLAIYMLGLLLTWSRGPWFATVTAFLLIAMVYRRRVIWVAITFVLAALVAVYASGNLGIGGRFDPLSPDFDSQRFQYWRIGFSHFLNQAAIPANWSEAPQAILRWALGRGPDATIATMNGYQSDYITILVESGILGIIVHLWFAISIIFWSFRRFLQSERRIPRMIALGTFGCSVTWIVGGFFGDLIKDPQYYLLLMSLLGLSVAAEPIKSKSNEGGR
jgi:O-antigen ligase